MRDRFIWKKLKHDFGETTDTLEQEEYHLKVVIKKATNLFNADKNKLLKRKVSDPYVQCWVSGLVKQQLAKTKTILSNLNPIWDEEVVLRLTLPEQRAVLFQVWDKNFTTKSEELGATGISLAEIELKQGKPLDLVLNVYHESEKHGQLFVQLTALDFSIERGDFDPQQHYGEIDMSVCRDLGHGRSKKSILRNVISPDEDRKLDKLFNWVHVDEIYDSLDTGDIILKSGVGTFSTLIMLGLRCMYSHAAVIIKDPTPAMKAAYNVPDDVEGNVYVLEADSELFDRTKTKGGVQFMELRYWLEEYYKESGPTDFTCVRKLTLPAQYSFHKDASRIENFVCGMRDTVYEQNKMDLVKCISKKNRKTGTVAGTFCSEIVAQTLIEMGLLPEKTIAGNYSPKDFSTLCNWLNSVLLHGATYSKEQRIRFVLPTEDLRDATELPDVQLN